MLSTDKNHQENTKCLWTVTTADTALPLVKVIFQDKKEMMFDATQINAKEIQVEIKRYSKKLQMAEDIKNAS